MTRIQVAVALALLAGNGACFGSVLKPDEAALKAAPASFDFGAWDALTAKYVDDKGRVDYQALKANAADMQTLEQLFAEVAKQKPDALPSKSAREAFYLDAYNVAVWKNVLTRLPKLKNVDGEKASFFYFTKFVVAGKEINLKDLESDVVRPTFKDPRVHMALNCASGGCPQLPNHAFVPAKLEEQLDHEAKKFVAEKRNVDFDATKKKLRLSHIFDWYRDDFGKKPESVIAWINKYRAADAQLPTDAKLDYVDYDWTLNDKSLPR